MGLKFHNILWAIAFLLVILAWISGLFIDLTGDSGLYAAISRQMVESGNWFDLKINDRPYYHKPHLLFWLAGMGIQLTGNSNLGFKLFLFLFGIAGIYFAYRLARLFYNETAGKLAALFTGTSQMYFLYFLDIHTDTVLQSAVIFSLWQFASYMKFKKPLNFILGFTGIGLALMAKGPVGAVIPFFFVLFYLLLKKDYRQLFHLKWIAGIIWVLILISPVLYYLWKTLGHGGLQFYFIENNLGRISGELAGSSSDPFFYIYNLLWAFLPWTIPLLAGLASEIRSWFHGRNVSIPGASLLGSALVLFMIYSIARGKSPNYLMILMPPMAVVATGRIQQIISRRGLEKPVLVYFHYVVLGMMAFLPFVPAFMAGGHGWLLPGMVAGLILVFSLIFYKAEPSKVKRLVFVSLIVSGVINLYLNTQVIPGLFKYQGARQALKLFKEHRSPEGVMKNLHLEEYELFYWADIPVEDFTSWEDFYAFLKTEEPWIYTNYIGLPVVRELTESIDSVFVIRQKGMNELTFQFLNPATREESLTNNYLIKVK